jgi:hypothetical protein
MSRKVVQGDVDIDYQDSALLVNYTVEIVSIETEYLK